jgi:hypothetical protein
VTDRVKELVRLLAETDGVIADIQLCLHEFAPAEAGRMRSVEAEMKMIRHQIESALKKLRPE